MPRYTHRYSLTALAAMTLGLAGCGSDDKSLEDFGIETSSPLVCKSPQTINAAGTACELIITACTFPEVSNEETGLCEQFLGEWPDGSNGIDMPEPIAQATPKDGGGFSDVLYFYNQAGGGFDGWGLHYWNNSECASYSEFSLEDGTTQWGVPGLPEGEDPNFGIYWRLDVIDSPNCTNFIPYNFDAGAQANDLSVDLRTDATNPTGAFYMIARNPGATGDERIVVGEIFPYPRTIESIVVPGAAPPTVECELPEVPNEDSTQCLDPIIGEFTPGAVPLYVRGGFNDWSADSLNDTTAFHYEEGIYTVTMTIAPNPDDADGAWEFKLADFDFVDETTFGVAQGTAEERTIVLGEPVALLTGKLATTEDRDVEANARLVVAEETSYQFVLNAQVAASPTLTVTEVPVANTLFVRGSMNNNGNDENGDFSLASGVSVLSYQGENQFSSRLVLAADTYTFNVADALGSEALTFGAASDDTVLTINTSKTLVVGAESTELEFTVEEEGAYIISLDVTDLAAPTLIVRSSVPYGDETVYLRGSMTDWVDPPADSHAFSYEGEGIYIHKTSLDVSQNFFKVASADWAAVDFGGGDDGAVVTLGEAKTLSRGGDNLDLNITEAGDYLLHLDANLREAPVLTVRNLQTYGEETIYLRGSLNDWADPALESEAMTYAGNGVYAITVELAAAEEPYAFKVASGDWDNIVVDLGATSDDTAPIELGVPETTASGGSNMTLTVTEETAGKFSFTVDTTNAEAPVLNVFRVDDFYLRGSMNDWADPPADSQRFATENGVDYSLEVELASGANFFKIATADWEFIEFAAPDADRDVTIGVPKMLSNGGENIELDTTDAAGMYKFEFRLPNLQESSITVTTVEE